MEDKLILPQYLVIFYFKDIDIIKGEEMAVY